MISSQANAVWSVLTKAINDIENLKIAATAPVDPQAAAMPRRNRFVPHWGHDHGPHINEACSTADATRPWRAAECAARSSCDPVSGGAVAASTQQGTQPPGLA